MEQTGPHLEVGVGLNLVARTHESKVGMHIVIVAACISRKCV